MNKARQRARQKGSGSQQAAAQEQSPHQPEAISPMTAGCEDLVAAGYEILAREPLTVYVPPGLNAEGTPPALTPGQEAVREEKIRQGLEKILAEEEAGIRHVVHPGWAAAFRWGLDYAERKRREEGV